MINLAIELTNRCNAKCPFCINKRFKKFGDMSDEIFDKLLRDMQELEIDNIILNNIGEPFLRVDIIDKIKKIREVFPETKIVMFSNGSLLTIKILEELKKLKIVLCVSLNSYNSESRKIMALNDFEKTKKLIDLGLKMKVIHRVTFVEIAAKSKEDIDKFFNLYPKPIGQILPYANWAGVLFDTFEPKHGCYRAKNELTVLFDGIVSLCCMTSLKVNFGNIKDKSLKVIWESKERQDYKITAEKGELFGVCSNCTGA